MGLNHIEQLINSEDMTSQTDNHLGNLCCDSHCSIVLHTFSKIHNFLISYPILLKLFLIGLSDFSAFIESKLFFEWTCPLKRVEIIGCPLIGRPRQSSSNCLMQNVHFRHSWFT